MESSTSLLTSVFLYAMYMTIQTYNTAYWADSEGLHITGHWEVTFGISGCTNLQIGLFGPTKSTSEGYFLDLNKESGGKFYSAIRKICPGCPGTPEVKVDQGESYFFCDSWLDVWVSWDGCTIRLGKGTVVKEQEVVSWMDPHMTEIMYITFGTSDGSRAEYYFDTMEADLSVQTIQNCSCAAQARPVFSPTAPAFIFHLSAERKTFFNPEDLILEVTGLTPRECNHKCLCDQACIQYSVSTTGVCKLSNKCYQALESDSDSTVHSLTNWSGKK